MVYLSNSSSLPPEILKLSVAQEYFDNDISITVEENQLDSLLKDIPVFGHTVKIIKLEALGVPNFFREEEDWVIKWWDIITMYPNLTSIYLNSDINKFIVKLGSSEERLKSIQKIQVNDIIYFPLDIQELYIRANIRHSETITSLEISNWELNPVVLESGGLIGLVSKFPHLTYVKVGHKRHTNRGVEVNITQLLKTAPKLQELKVYGVAKIASGEKAENLEKLYLTKLKLTAEEINITSLYYVIENLSDQLDNIRLIISKVNPDKSISEEESKEIINKLETLITGMQRVNIDFEYKGEIFSRNYGKKARKGTSEDGSQFGSYYDDHIKFADCVDDPFFYDDEY